MLKLILYKCNIDINYEIFNQRLDTQVIVLTTVVLSGRNFLLVLC